MAGEFAGLHCANCGSIMDLNDFEDSVELSWPIKKGEQVFVECQVCHEKVATIEPIKGKTEPHQAKDCQFCKKLEGEPEKDE